MVKSVQYLPAGRAGTTAPQQGVSAQQQQQQQAPVYQQPPSYGVQASRVAFPAQTQALPPGAMGHVPGVAYDMRTYGDAFSNGYPSNMSSKEM